MMEKPKFDIVFVVLVYRNTDDLKDFFLYNHIKNSHTIVVNSYYDDVSECAFAKIAEDNAASYISVPNKGYGAGNNRGIEYALDHFKFEYLVISNADIMIEKMDISALRKEGEVIIAPKILTLKGKNQNPSSPFAPHLISLKIMSFLYAKGNRTLTWPLHVWSRLKKIFFYMISPVYKTVFSAHGAFVIIPYGIICKLHPLFNEEMFLEFEEQHLGMYAKTQGVKTCYAPNIVIRHKEDGSMKIASVNEFEVQKQSFGVYYNYWFLKHKK